MVLLWWPIDENHVSPNSSKGWRYLRSTLKNHDFIWIQVCSNELKCVCYLGWAGEDCNSTSPLSYLVVGPTASVSGSARHSLPPTCYSRPLIHMRLLFTPCQTKHHIFSMLLSDYFMLLFLVHHHSLFFVYTHSLSTGRCLWRRDLRLDLSSFFFFFMLVIDLSFPESFHSYHPELKFIEWTRDVFDDNPNREPLQNRKNEKIAAFETHCSSFCSADTFLAKCASLCGFACPQMVWNGNGNNTNVSDCLCASGITSTNIIISAIVGSFLFLALILAVTAWCYKWVTTQHNTELFMRNTYAI